MLGGLTGRAIPALVGARTALDYHSIPIDSQHPMGAEPLVRASSYGLASESFYGRTDRLNAPYFERLACSLKHVWCRRSVAERLSRVNDSIKSIGIEFYLLDGYRSLACQQALWEFHMNAARKQLDDPTEQNCRRFVGRYWSDPSAFDAGDSSTWPTHMTGGAIDLTIRRLNSGEVLYMGGTFDDTSEVSHTRFYESENVLCSLSHEQARHNRRLLYWLMTDAGFANYSYEWWHYDFGTQMWVMNRAGSDAEGGACYGAAAETEELLNDRA